MMINEGFTHLMIEERTKDLRSAGHWRWSRRRHQHTAAAGHPAPSRPRG
ncbi:MAG TPA: hypothetical protein VKB57_24205 [Acidimicrobiales bacterium]|nr:hypothetical protein [Acidimicrobiales bacterium]